MSVGAIEDWNAVSGYALSLPDTVVSTHYGSPAVKISSNGRAFVTCGLESSSFVLSIDQDMKQMLIETDPETYWQTAHYEGWPALLVRFGSEDPDRVMEMIGLAHEEAAAKKPVKPRKPG